MILAQSIDLSAIATQAGIPSALIMFFSWQSWKREMRMANSIEKMQKFQTSSLLELNERSLAALNAATAAINRISLAVEQTHCPMNGRIEAMGCRSQPVKPINPEDDGG